MWYMLVLQIDDNPQSSVATINNRIVHLANPSYHTYSGAYVCKEGIFVANIPIQSSTADKTICQLNPYIN